MNWRRFLHRRDADAEQREELDFYLDVTTDEYIERGMDPAAARAAALRKLGNTTLIREEVYRMNTVTFVEGVLKDARHALRMIRRNPAFSATAILTLALGIGANTAMFSVFRTVLLRPLPYPNADALVYVANRLVIQGKVFEDADLSPGMYAACKQNARAFENFGVWEVGTATVTGAGDPEQLVTVKASQGVLPALGVQPHAGRWFSIEDDRAGTPPTAILSYGYWQRRFGGDPTAIGRTVLVNFIPREVIGVMPAGFRVAKIAPDILLPEQLPVSGSVDEFSYFGLARLKPGVTLAMANQDVARVWKIWGEATGTTKTLEMLKVEPNLRTLKKDVVGNVGPMLTLLMGALALVLLLVCANVANLVLVRAQSRQQELAIRTALGASWWRIAREVLVESLTLGGLGGALGLAIAYVSLRVLVTQGPANLPRLAEISLDGAALAFVVGCSTGSSVLFGLAAVLRCGRPGGMQMARGATRAAAQLRAQNALVVMQVALAFVLLTASGLMVRSFAALRAVRPGFTHPEWIQTARISIPEALAPKPEQVTRMQAQILGKLAAIPGVRGTGFGNGLPLEPEYQNGILIAVEGKTSPDQMPPNRAFRGMSPGLLAAQGTRLVAGRDFTWDDVFGDRRVAIVSENFAREYWGDAASAVGKRIGFGNHSPWNEVVGVAEDVHADGMNLPAPPTVYGHIHGGRGMTFAVRSERTGTDGFLREIAAQVHAVNPNLPLARVRTLNDVYRQSMTQTSLALVLLGVAAAMSLTLAMVGVYGVLAYAVARRRHEVGIRLALGAAPGAVQWLFVRRGLMLNCVGGVIGLGLAAALSRWIASLLFGLTPFDPVSYAAAAGLIGVAVTAGSYLPARQASRVDPMETLGSE
jgi:putative ABC transport system permease protein